MISNSVKSINVTHDHLAGDHILKVVADIARARDGSNGGQFDPVGGEGFIVLLLDTEFEAAPQVAERLRENIARMPIKVPNAELNITGSFGVAANDENTPDMETLLARADQAMYIAKYMGRNRLTRSK